MLKGDFIKDLRQERGWSRRVMSQVTGLTEQTIINAENGNSVSQKTLQKIAKALGREPGELKGEES